MRKFAAPQILTGSQNVGNVGTPYIKWVRQHSSSHNLGKFLEYWQGMLTPANILLLVKSNVRRPRTEMLTALQRITPVELLKTKHITVYEHETANGYTPTMGQKQYTTNRKRV